MAQTGLVEVVYAENAVKHILSGKAIARAIRGHFMVHAALNTMLTANAYNITLPVNEESRDEAILHQSLMDATKLYDEIMADASATSNLSAEDVLHEIRDQLKATKQTIINRRTAKLWLQYNYEDDRHSTYFHQSRENWRLESAPPGCSRNASIFCCSWS